MKLSYVRQHFFDLRLPVVAPSRVLWVWWKNMAGKAERRWPAFVSRCECEMRRAATRQTMATIAALAAKPYFAGLLLRCKKGNRFVLERLIREQARRFPAKLKIS